MTITIIGTGFVGVVTAAVLSSKGHQVYGLDVDEPKVQSLQSGVIPFFEPGLEELLAQELKKGTLHFTTSYQEAISVSDIVMISVGTPSAPDGQADLKYVFAAAESLAPHLKDQAIVVVKSTVPPGTNSKVAEKIQPLTKVQFYTASVPEFLREGSAVTDTLHPDRVVIGATGEFVFQKLEELHQGFEAPVFRMSPESAQMAKYSANSYLATRITFINHIADLCEKNGADVMEVIKGMSGDKRIGAHYWYPGFGYGGSCFPKDVKELAAYSRSVGETGNLFNRITQFNEERMYLLMDKFEKKIGGWEGKKIAVLGLSFKPNTDDTREAPAMKIIPHLLSKGAQVTGFDPMAKHQETHHKYSQEGDVAQAVKEADVIMTVIEWSDITRFDFGKTRESKQQWFIDGRDQFDPLTVTQWGYEYIGVGR